MKCPSCEREWPENCEQAICIESRGSCIPCNLHSITREEADEFEAESKRRKSSEERETIMDSLVKRLRNGDDLASRMEAAQLLEDAFYLSRERRWPLVQGMLEQATMETSDKGGPDDQG